MGIQDVQDVTLIRHAYVRSKNRRSGNGGKLLSQLQTLTNRPVLIGTWADASWAIRFYEKHEFRAVPAGQKGPLLKRYWNVPARQIETSMVLCRGQLAAEAGRSSSRRLWCRRARGVGPFLQSLRGWMRNGQ